MTRLTLRSLALLATLSLLPTSPSQASDSQQPPGHRIHFSVLETQSVANDTAEITFAYSAQGQTPQAVMNEINRHMQAALKSLRFRDDVQTQSSRYRVYPVHNKQRIITHWKGQQSLTLTTQNQQELGKLLTQVQPHLAYQSMQFRISDALRQKVLESLTLKTLKKYRAQAERIADSFDADEFEFEQTRIQPPGPQPVYRSHDMAVARTMAESAPPVTESGESTIRLQVAGTLLLPY